MPKNQKNQEWEDRKTAASIIFWIAVVVVVLATLCLFASLLQIGMLEPVP
jgi:hypothetical protein